MINSIKTVLKKLNNTTEDKGLDQVINPEIHNDVFFETIKVIASDPNLKTFLEIGSSSGSGSTKAFLEGLANRKDLNDIKFYCMELSIPRFNNLQNYIKNFPFAEAFNISSVASKEFPTPDEVIKFYNNNHTNLNDHPLRIVLDWLKQDIEYVKKSGKDFNGLQAIMYSKNIKNFDAVLIDGSEFTGFTELKYLIGSKYILLDDTETYKCRDAFLELQKNTNYKLIKHNPELRNGFAVFELNHL